MLAQQLVNGFTLGAIYALIALGYTMVYGILELINFAHGEIYMIGAYLAILVLGLVSASPLAGLGVGVALTLAFAVSALYCAAYGLTLERVAYRPLRHAPRLSPLLSAIGMSIVLQNYIMLTQGSADKVFPHLISFGTVSLMGASLSTLQLAILTTALLFMVGLHLFIARTRLGLAMRATAQDQRMASLAGVNSDQVIAVTFVIGSVLAAAAGFMVAMYYGVVNFSIGYVAGLKAFTAAVLGGIGNLPGAMFGGVILGVAESLAAAYISSEYKDGVAVLILIAVLFVRPTGLMGERVPEKV